MRAASHGVVALALAVAFAGCSREPAPAPEPSGTAAVGAIPAMHVSLSNAVLVSVNGNTLTSDVADRILRMRMAELERRVPADKLSDMRARMRKTIVDQFIARRLFMEEAARRGVTADEADIEKALARVGERFPSPTNGTERAAHEARMVRIRREVETGLAIEKLLAEELGGVTNVAPEDIVAFRVKHAESLALPANVRARHILIKVTDQDPEDVRTGKRKQAEAIRERLLAGGDFEQLAKTFSDCPSAQRGGDLGFFDRGKMAKPFEEAAFSQPVDDIGPVVQSQFGFHIIQVLQRNEASTLPDDKVRNLIIRERQQAAMQEFLVRLKKGADIRMGTAPR